MNYESYKGLKANEDLSIVDFISFGRNGAINKRVEFTPTEMDNIYNLAFGDIDENNNINDYVISNNGDRNKVLATIADIVKAYTEKYPVRWVLFEGSTEERTRLYRMAITLNLDYLAESFEIKCIAGGNILQFKKSMAIDAFLIKRKIS